MTHSALKNISYVRKFRLYLRALPNIIMRLINVEKEAGGWRPCTRFDASIWSYTLRDSKMEVPFFNSTNLHGLI